MTDEIKIVITIAAFALAVTTHVAILVGLAARKPRWRAVAALVVFPLAPAWAFRGRMPFRAFTWMGGVAAYVVMRFVDLR